MTRFADFMSIEKRAFSKLVENENFNKKSEVNIKNNNDNKNAIFSHRNSEDKSLKSSSKSTNTSKEEKKVHN
jgi:hypothetical protein